MRPCATLACGWWATAPRSRKPLSETKRWCPVTDDLDGNIAAILGVSAEEFGSTKAGSAGPSARSVWRRAALTTVIAVVVASGVAVELRRAAPREIAQPAMQLSAPEAPADQGKPAAVPVPSSSPAPVSAPSLPAPPEPPVSGSDGALPPAEASPAPTEPVIAAEPRKILPHDQIAIGPAQAPALSRAPSIALATPRSVPEEVQPPTPAPKTVRDSASSGVGVWLHSPTEDEVEEVFPLAAWKEGVEGSVLLRCRELEDGSVAGCRVLAEGPVGWGFGHAGLALSRKFRFAAFMLDGRPATRELEIPFDFNFAD